jgi:pyocin large subunit-like protein
VQQNEWDGSITKSQYNQKAERLLSDSDGEVYYQTGRRNLAVYDPSENAYAVGNVNGDIQTLFQPSQGRQYVSNKLQNGDLIRLK